MTKEGFRGIRNLKDLWKEEDREAEETVLFERSKTPKKKQVKENKSR